MPEKQTKTFKRNFKKAMQGCKENNIDPMSEYLTASRGKSGGFFCTALRRRLTPEECLRFQGFKMTRKTWEKHGLTACEMGGAAGNAMSVNVVQRILVNLLRATDLCRDVEDPLEDAIFGLLVPQYGYYCAGGSTDFAVRISCPVRRTTKTVGAVSQVACVCERGYQLGDDLQNKLEPQSLTFGRFCDEGIGFYKDEISDASCKACPQGLTTYMQGSVSNASCIDRPELLAESRNDTIQASNHSTVPAVVVRLELMDLPEAQTSMTSGLLDDLQAMLRAAISNVVGGPEALTLDILPAAVRRLASYNMQLELKIRHRTVQEAQLMLQDLDATCAAESSASLGFHAGGL
eukprot:s5680_g8.t1